MLGPVVRRSPGGLFFSREVAEVFPPSLRDPSSGGAMKMYSTEATSTARASLVLAILRGRDNSQICSAIVKAVAVDVICLLSVAALKVENDSVKQ